MKFLYSDLPAIHLGGRKLVGRVVFGMLVLGAICAGMLVGLLIVYSTNLPQISDLERYRPGTVTELYDVHGRSVGSFALQRRVLGTYDTFPKILRDAIISTEDKSFENHWGINLWRVLGATYRDISAPGTRAQGASTLTMQLSRNLFLSPERHFSRKVQEAMLAIQIERHFTKQQIFTLYCNQIALGHGMYGFEAGSQFYFGKHARDLKLEEAALLAGLPKGPSSYDPINYPERALRRRNLVINNMLEDGKITAEQAGKAKTAPLSLAPRTQEASPAPYFVEELRRYLEKKYGTSEVHEGGLRVYTSLDLDLQKAANLAVAEGLAAYERRRGWQGHLKNVMGMGESLDKYRHPDWDQTIEPGSYVHAVVADVGLEFATVRLGRWMVTLGPGDITLTGHKFPKDVFTPGDIIYVKVLALQTDGTARVQLEQDSGAQAALLAIDNATGDIKAMVGGRSFGESKFNRAIQAERQAGSSFKPYVYTAAVDEGADPDDTILDAATTFYSGGTAYTPHNYDHKFEGVITLRRALADSRNVPAVKLAHKVGMATVARYAKKFGLTAQIPLYLPIALGAADVTLYEQTSAYSVFPNDGVRIEPAYIRKVTDYDGHVLEENFAVARDVISPNTARIMVSLLEGVVQNGTARSAAVKLQHPLAGKTGTTNDYTDAWFVGFSPSITCGVWVGFDEKKSLGKNETGSQAALPVWIDFMRAAIADPARSHEAFQPALTRHTREVAVKRAAVSQPATASKLEAH